MDGGRNSLRLQKQLSKRVGKKEYAKWVIVIPPDKIREMGWKDGESLHVEIKKGEMVVKKDSN